MHELTKYAQHFDNDQGKRFSHLSNWEIKVFTKAIPELSKFALNNVVGQL